jgi:Cd2+/Zn2+-exporting ATPase
MCCASEVPPILQILEPLEGVASVKCNVTAKVVYVEHDFTVITAEKMESELNKDGFGASIKKDAGKSVVFNPTAGAPVTVEAESSLESFGLPRANVIVCGILWIVSMFAPAFPHPYEKLEYLALAAFVVGIYPIALKTWDSVRRYNMDANLLMFIAAVGAIGLQQYSEAAGLTFLFSLGEWLEGRATGKAKRALESIVSLRPDTANKQVVGEGGQTEFVEVPAEYVAVGDIVLVKTGDKIPVDGEVVKGESVVDESSLTGESRPVKKKAKSQVSSGTINIGMAPLTIVCTATTENSTVSKLIELVAPPKSWLMNLPKGTLQSSSWRPSSCARCHFLRARKLGWNGLRGALCSLSLRAPAPSSFPPPSLTSLDLLQLLRRESSSRVEFTLRRFRELRL